MLADDAIDAAQVQRLAIAPAEATDLLAETGDVAEQAERGVVEFLSLLGQLETAVAAPAQGIAQAHLQVAHQHAQARQAGVQARLGGSEAAGLDDGAEGAQHAQVDVVEVAQHSRPMAFGPPSL